MDCREFLTGNSANITVARRPWPDTYVAYWRPICWLELPNSQPNSLLFWTAPNVQDDLQVTTYAILNNNLQIWHVLLMFDLIVLISRKDNCNVPLLNISTTYRSLKYRSTPRAVIFTIASSMKTDVKKKLKIFKANCNSYNKSHIFFWFSSQLGKSTYLNQSFSNIASDEVWSI